MSISQTADGVRLLLWRGRKSLLATAVGRAGAVVVPALPVMRRLATSALHQIGRDRVATDLADRRAEPRRGVVEEFNAADAGESRLLVQFEGQHREARQRIVVAEFAQLLHQE